MCSSLESFLLIIKSIVSESLCCEETLHYLQNIYLVEETDKVKKKRKSKTETEATIYKIQNKNTNY
jgi:hypothetical protein